ncbi:MAG: fucose isomerase [Clostridia bacterium]|nr:fucose isomerase [Clostridia bacterium]
MHNIPTVKLGIITVSRACFPVPLSESRRAAIAAACPGLYECKVTVENERDMLRAVEDVNAQGVNAVVVFLGNFGPETPETLIAKYFDGPVMFAAAAEENGDRLMDGGRGDAFCGMLNCSYNLNLRNLRAYIPGYPVGTAKDIAEMIAGFSTLARAVLGIRSLKIIGFGPRPDDFLACNAPIQALYDMGVEVQENSELDLLMAYRKHDGDLRIPAVVEEMQKEMSPDASITPILPKLAQYQITLLDWAEATRGASKYVAFANKCWPSFAEAFGFVPCYVNSRLASRGIPAACETDIYGVLSEYIIALATKMPPTLLDINNTVPADMVEANKKEFGTYKNTDLFMGFHCGNTPSCHLAKPEIKHQLIMKRALEPDGEPDITRGTLEGTIKSGKVTIFRLQSTADTQLKSYVAEGEVLNVLPNSFGGIGVFAISEMGRFYRHVLIAKRYPHHTGVGFKHAGKTLFAAMKLLGIADVAFNQPAGMLYPDENPFA